MPEDCTTDCAVSSTMVAIAVGSPERIDPSRLPGLDRRDEVVEDGALAGAESLDDVGEQQVGIGPQDLHEQRVGPDGLDRPHDRRNQLLTRRPGAGVRRSGERDLPGQQVGDDRAGIGPTPVDGRPAHPRPTRDFGERGPPHPELEHARAGSVENLVGRFVTDGHRM